MAIVAVLLATMGFTGVLSPPGGWSTTANTLSALALSQGSNVRAQFYVFVISNTCAMGTSLALVIMIAVGNSFGLVQSARSKTAVLYSPFALLALAVLAAMVAFVAASAVVSSSVKWLTGVVPAVLLTALAPVLFVLKSLISLAKVKSRTVACGDHRLAVQRAASRLLDALRVLNNSYITHTSDIVGDPVRAVAARYFVQYTIVTLATVIPLLRFFNKIVEDAAVSKVISDLCQDFLGWCNLCSLLEGHDFHSLYSSCQPWDVGIQGVVANAGCATAIYRSCITGGSWPNPNPNPDGHGAGEDFTELVERARMAVVDLMFYDDLNKEFQETPDKAVKAYQSWVKQIFMQANISRMMATSIQGAIV